LAIIEFQIDGYGIGQAFAHPVSLL